MTTTAYIDGIGAISIQDTFTAGWDGLAPVSYGEPHVRCIDPVFREYLDPLAARRMSRIIKRAVLSSEKALAVSGVAVPDIIVAGTGLGCVEDTEKFLDAMAVSENCLQPTNFIQSTHNTIASQVAIRLKCNGYNNTHVHRAVSFESALVESLLLLGSGRGKTALVGGHDEMTPGYFNLLKRLGYWRAEVPDTLKITSAPGKGSFAGEGSVAFVLSKERTDRSMARVAAAEMNYKPADAAAMVSDFLKRAGITPDEIDLIFTGASGDAENDAVYNNIYADDAGKTGHYKHLCGEYFTAPAFGMMCAAEILRTGNAPAWIAADGRPRTGVKNILMHNHARGANHSLILLRSC